MKKYFGEDETEIILSIYRKYLSTNQLNLSKEKRQLILDRIDLKKFTCFHDWWGLVGYDVWAMPILLIVHPSKLPSRLGEGLESDKMGIYREMRRKILALSLVEVWEGKVTDQMLILAALIEAGHYLKVLPKMKTYVSQVDAQAKMILKERKIEHEDQQQIRLL